jgi:hypothetical protein
MAAYSKALKVGERATHAGRNDVHSLNTLSAFWPIGAPSAMKRLFMDSDGPPVFSSFVLHPCNFPLNRPFGTFASIARGRWLRTVDRARKYMSEVSSPWIRGGRPLVSSAPANEIAVCESPTTEGNPPQVEGVLFRGEPFLHPEERFIHNVVWSHQMGHLLPPRQGRSTYKDSLLGSARQGDPWPLAPNQGPWGSSSRASRRTWSTGCRKHPAGTRPEPQGVAALRSRIAVPTRLGRNKQGDPWVPGTRRGPMGFLAKSDLAYGYDKEVQRRSGTVARATGRG